MALAEYEVEPEEIEVPELGKSEGDAERELALTYSELALFIDLRPGLPASATTSAFSRDLPPNSGTARRSIT